MGLKTINYKIKNLGITIPTAYARIASVHTSLDGRTSVVFEIQQNREDIGTKDALERKLLRILIDKKLSSYEQAYNKAKEELFADWEDDIVE